MDTYICQIGNLWDIMGNSIGGMIGQETKYDVEIPSINRTMYPHSHIFLWNFSFRDIAVQMLTQQ